MNRLVHVNSIRRDMSREFPRVKLELVADPDVRDRFKLEIKCPEIHLSDGSLHVYVDCGDLSNLSHDITVARLEDDQRSGKLDVANL